jgi:uncharacterized protein YkwD
MLAARLAGLLLLLTACNSVVLEEYIDASAAAIGPTNQAEYLAQVNGVRTNPAGQICYGEDPQGKLKPKVGALTWNAKLAAAAYYHAKDIAEHGGTGKFSNGTAHISSDGSTLVDRVTRAGYRYFTVGEDLAAGQATARDAVYGTPGNAGSGWLQSRTQHCEILMDEAFEEMGMAMYQGTGGTRFWALVVGKSR